MYYGHSKHESNNQSFPVGHPERLRAQERVSQQQTKVACTVCGSRFQLPAEVEKHVRLQHGDETRLQFSDNHQLLEPTWLLHYYVNNQEIK